VVFAPDLMVSGRIVSKATGSRDDTAFVVDTESGLIVKTGNIVDVGGWVMAQRRYSGRAVAAEHFGGFVLSGLSDAHEHPVLYASLSMMGAVSVYGANTSAEVVNKLGAAFPDDAKASIIGTGLNTAVVKDLCTDHLEQLFPGQDVVVYDGSFHGAVVSRSLGAKIESLMKSRPNAAGHLDKNGCATEDYGLSGLEIIEAAYTQEELEGAIEAKLDKYLRQGITSVHDLCMRSTKQVLATLTLRKRWKQEWGYEFPITRMYMRPKHIAFVVEHLSELERSGLLTSDDFRRMCGLKLFADGSFGSYTAKLSKPYINRDSDGAWFDTPEYIHDSLALAAEHGITTVAMHAIGDAGVNQALITASDWTGMGKDRGFDPVFRIEHFELPLPLKETLHAARELGIVVVPQHNFLLDAPYRDRLGDRVDFICPHRSILDAGIPMMSGTDGMPDSVLYAIYLATHANQECQRLTLQEAIAAATVAVGRFEGDNRGTLEVGQKADVILANGLLFTMSHEGEGDPNLSWNPAHVEALEHQINRVYKGGQEVYALPPK